ncbi:LacI family DNA-binding transcriptional regulator [Amycolatopsis viridis]|uniref:DNA-binding LacI/PurR family transcriptional regulator n=1 Tax=Amycolatopsis viridis TaxID=185678 RepID=A0ABX0SS35_9PSEU|nr:LacI family DNA-binding transcriptional regulator [Amycolatopsis viridis]NIH78464.1 DNA-binding LacI/PurR family transcriptional regulator [Amycolatopsis viridis]
MPASPRSPERRPPTILSIAAAAGVSKSVVSRVMRNEPGVSARSRQRVLNAAESLGYTPNAAARSLVQKRSNNIGVLVTDLHNPFFVEVLDGINRAAAEHGYRTIITTSSRDPLSESHALQQLIELRADAIVLAGPLGLGTELVADVAGRVPVASLEGSIRVPSVDLVLGDDHQGAQLAVEHLAALGHQRIALIDGGTAHAATRRRAGYEDAMRRLGLADQIHVAPGEFTEEGGYQGVHRLFSRPGPRPTAVFASNDLAAIGAINALESLDLRVPGDVSVVGYDNTWLAAMRHISLTTIDQPRPALGEVVVAALLRRIDQAGGEGRHRLLPPRLVVRATTAAPRPQD